MRENEIHFSNCDKENHNINTHTKHKAKKKFIFEFLLLFASNLSAEQESFSPNIESERKPRCLKVKNTKKEIRKIQNV